MMKITPIYLCAFLLLFPGLLLAERFGERYCNEPGYYCMTIQSGESWGSLFPYAKHQDIVKRLNRINLRLRPGMRIAVPEDIDFLETNDIAPFSLYMEPGYTNRIVVDLDELAWGAYSEEGELVKWGPISGGKRFCPDVKRPCPTLQGDFTVYREGTAKCKSKKFPVGKGGAKMPFCMFYDGGYAIHGSYSVPGYHASHGCVRTFIDDARWLNEDFVQRGWTRVTIR
jgi:hypothetical protein